jgi:multidrug efflux system outer membrane protein
MMGQDYERPHPGTPVPGKFQHTGGQAPGGIIEDHWWEAFEDERLNRLAREVLERNLDVRKASARILEVRARFVQTTADRYPVINLQGQVQRQRKTVTTTIPTFTGIITEQNKTTIDAHTLSLPASFELDLWGRLARADEAARADLLQAEESRRTITQTAVSEAISLYLQIESLERRLWIAQESVQTYRKSLALVEGRYERGLTSILDVRQARRLLAQAESSLPGLRQELGTTQQRLAVLAGRYPETAPARDHPEDYFKRLEPVPTGLPADLLKRRPDIRAAEAGLQALNARVGAAKASRFPRITLTGSFGFASEDLSLLFEPESELYSIAMGMLQPLFDAGKLKAAQRAAEARYLQGVVEYARTVLSAFADVEGALLTRKEQLERRDRVMAFLNEARATQKVAENRYRRGLVDYLTVLEATQTRFQAEESLVGVDLALLTNRVTLHRALGGGWAEPAAVEKGDMTGLRSLAPF